MGTEKEIRERKEKGSGINVPCLILVPCELSRSERFHNHGTTVTPR